MNTLCVLGRQPALGLAELESLLGSDKVQALGTSAAQIAIEPGQLPFSRLGGTIKAARVLHRLSSTNWHDIESYLVTSLSRHLELVPEGKLKLGLSVYDLPPSPQQINKSALAVKKVIKSSGRNVRIVPNKETALNTAQVLHNHLTGQTGVELLLVRDKNNTIIAQTFAVQDINAYAARDQARPKRDARVGMLPPKLAQIIINLAVDRSMNHESRIMHILDPFCGTGVLLQEALLMGYNIFGTDLDPRMIEYSSKNVIDWFNMTIHPEIRRKITIAQADATNYSWEKFDMIASETYLGRPFPAEPRPGILEEVVRDVSTIHYKFLQNVAKQTLPGFKMCIAVPAWKTKNGFKHLPVLDSLPQLGYNRVSFVHVRDQDLIYHRPNQIVGRELVTLVRK